mgnify:CR=1 FL=1
MQEDEAQFLKDNPVAAAPPPESSDSVKELPEKYLKMKKMGIPEGAIKHKMAQDEVKNIESYFEEAPGTAKKAAPISSTKAALLESLPPETFTRQPGFNSRKYTLTMYTTAGGGFIHEARMKKDGTSIRFVSRSSDFKVYFKD